MRLNSTRRDGGNSARGPSSCRRARSYGISAFPRRLTRLLDDHLPDGLEAVPEIEVITSASFPPSVRDPDIVVVPDRVFERRPARVPAADVVLVVEIVSPGSRGTDHVMKLHEYAKAGIEHYWIVDPDAPADDRFLAYRLDGETYRRVTALDGDRVRVNEPTKNGIRAR